MFIDTRAINFPLTGAIQNWVDARIRTALRPFENVVLRVVVRLQDINSPQRGGIDKRCSIVATLRPRDVVVAEAIHADLYQAINEAAMRVRRPLTRMARRRLDRERDDIQRPGALLTG